MEEATNKSIVSHAKSALLSTIKGKIDIPRFPAKPPRIKNLVIFSTREKFPVSILSVSASAQELRSLEDIEKETVEAIEIISSPRGLLEETVTCSGSETSPSKASPSSLDIQTIHNNASLWRGFFRLWRQKSLRRLSSFPPLGVARIKWKNGTDDHEDQVLKEAFESESCFFKPSWKTFTTVELQKVTNNFSEENLIGKGGFAEVYEGCLDDGQFVAVKRLNNGSIEERTNSFLSELGILVHIDHPNIAKLIGVGVEDDLHLVLRLSPHGSLSTILHGNGSKEKLEWEVRYKIAIGTAEGIHYLHESCPRRIIHRDIKTANILLTEDFEPEICDFGLAKWLPDQLTHHTVSCFEGTFGYLAPEYITHGIVDEKTDIFAFGVLLLELISGRKALDSSQHSLVLWARPLLEKNEIKELVDPSISDSYDPTQLKYVIETASLCIQHSSMLRPKIGEAISMLKGEEVKLISPSLHQKTRRRTYSEELFDAEEYNATRYLNDLNRHKQIALDFKAAGE